MKCSTLSEALDTYFKIWKMFYALISTRLVSDVLQQRVASSYDLNEKNSSNDLEQFIVIN